MGEIAINVEALGKKYHIGGLQKSYYRLTDQLADIVAAPFRRAGNLIRGDASGVAELGETIWALKDISFQIKPGEVVGIIGRNGAGKSTLLKILSGITDPTDGYADIYGRVGSLLEVGTGFHPDLTGRENIYLNGAILGMKKTEIDRKLDEIVAFAEIDKFLDTPVKHYSSGMYVRLAFSVAAHLEPEILLVDEVLAVGDTAFQRKCLGKMDDVAQAGRTVVFVSHNMGLLQALCQRGIFLHQGGVDTDGTITEAVDAYLQTLEQARSHDLSGRTDRKGQGRARLLGAEVVNDSDGSSSILKTGKPARFVFYIDTLLLGMACDFHIYDTIGQPVTSFKSRLRGPDDAYDPSLGLKFVCDIDELLLLPGRYRIDVAIVGDNRLQDFIEAAAVFEVGDGHVGGRPAQHDGKFSVVMSHRWTLPTKL
ncbi:MAG TPA: ABC transporter ATP-binding protein [Anaerolineales bacterium]|jgi:lipopolysaccharide transport system ATP-binding protein|nr:ABC transporter ATP-binding protein [Anaerolineales bacterium]